MHTFSRSRSYSTNVTENLLRLKAPNTIEEQNEIWDVTSELMDEVNLMMKRRK